MVLKRENYFKNGRKNCASLGIEPYTLQKDLTYFTSAPSGLHNNE
jgi:hypothetical protein